jgi:hypothetical protein
MNFQIPHSKTINGLLFQSKLAFSTMLITLFLLVAQAGFALDPRLSGQVELRNGDIVESAYNTNDGSLVFLLTPHEKHGHDGDHDRDDDHEKSSGVAPLYIVVYPTSVSGIIKTVNCQHQPADNCPDHGPVFAGLAEATVPSVYGNGVWGHDHIGPFPASRRGDSPSVTWVPVAVMFTTLEAASTHITTIDQLHAAEKAGQVTEVVLWDAAFQASQTSASVYLKGTPVPPGPPTP